MVGATWDGKAWKVQVEEVQTGRLVDAECDILINANGILNNWNWPDIPDLDKFQGKLLHSANWDTTVSLDNKSVGLVGNGCVVRPLTHTQIFHDTDSTILMSEIKQQIVRHSNPTCNPT